MTIICNFTSLGFVLVKFNWTAYSYCCNLIQNTTSTTTITSKYKKNFKMNAKKF